jgi:hypothetical protein
MAKRIRVKGKNPRGLSKAQRMRKGLEQEFDSGYRKHYNKTSVSEPHVSEVLRPEDVLRDNPRFKGGVSRPSSTRKKRVKEGSRKFIGPRQLSSEIAEDLKTSGRLRPRLENLDLEPLVTAGNKRSLNYGDLRKALTDYLIKTGKIQPF